ncbi:MAG: aminopeptidase N [Streptosporangiales bacterium]|nr:aminopeptidase N [Streptosporangiales bacterium]
MAGNLTRDEARERARLLDVESYEVELDLTVGDETFTSTTTVRFRAAEPGADTFIDLAAPAVREITLNGRSLDVAEAFTGERVLLTGLAERNELRVVADAAYMRTGEGLHRFVDPVDGGVYLHSQFETADAQRMYAGFDQPDLKASFELTVFAPEGFEVVSNAIPDVVREPAGADRVRWHFAPTPRISTYITALIAGPYHVVRDEHDGIPLGVYCRASLAEHLDADKIIEVTRQGFDFYHRVFGLRYPFTKYDQLFVPEFNAGAMENAGAVTFLEDYVFRSRVTDALYERRAETILHEMAHMWFGDLVTMRWWDDLWLNESFATYASTLCQSEATRWRGAWTTFANVEKAWAYRQDQLPSTHPIAADIVDIQAVEVNFDGITYAKGASVLKQLVAYVGLDNFLEGVRRYFQRHAWGNTTLQDLLTCLEETSGRGDLAEWSKEWLQTAGVNTLRPEFQTGDGDLFTSFAMLQEAPEDHPTLRTHRVAIGLYDRTDAGIVRRRRVELDISGPRNGVPELVGERRPDLVLINDDDLTYAKLRLDERSLVTVISGIADIRESLPRALAWGAAWDMCRDAEMATRDYIELIASGVRAVTDITVAQTLLRQATLAVQLYADPEWRDTGRARLAGVLRGLLDDAVPGSDLQLAYLNAFLGVAGSADELAFVRGLLDGSERLEGLTVDTDLRWGLLRRLASRGAAAEAEIDAELERDATAAGERNAAACRAALPTPEAKRAAWERIVGGDLANATYRSTLGGFFQGDQPELLEPYVEPFFDAVGGIWRTWTGDMAQTFAVAAYPAAVIKQDTIDRTEAYIASEEPPAALRRLLREGADGVRRALAAQECDRAKA